MKLSKNFSLSEFTKSQTASRRGISNKPGPHHVDNLSELVQNVLQVVRDHFGPVVISSGFRSRELNAAIGGTNNSQHSKGEAADFEVIGVSNAVVAEWIRDNLEFDQLILEFYTPGEPNSGWVHVSYKEDNNRNEVLTAVKEGGRVVYKRGLVV